MNQLKLMMLTSGLITLFGLGAQAGLVDFDAVPLGTRYGVPAHFSGQTVLIQNNIGMSVWDFYYHPAPTSGSTFNYADIVEPPSAFAPNTTQALHTNNINVEFDFTNLDGHVSKVSLEFNDRGGDENFDINGIGLKSYLDFTGIGPGSYPGFDVHVNAVDVDGGLLGFMEIVQTGANPIQTLRIGGQELGIDTIEAPVAGDLNGDGKSNFDDLSPFVKALIDPVEYAAAYPGLDRIGRCDVSRDGACNFGDLTPFSELLTADPRSGSAVVPEPAAMALLCGSLALLGWQRWRPRRRSSAT